MCNRNRLRPNIVGLFCFLLAFSIALGLYSSFQSETRRKLQDAHQRRFDCGQAHAVAATAKAANQETEPSREEPVYGTYDERSV